MEFGKLSSIENVDWSLPPDDPVSVSYLNSLSSKGRTKFYIGTPAWNHKEWIGKIYPAKTKPADFLSYYAQNFNTIELNTTHYGIPNSDKYSGWLKQVSSDFLFCPKLLQNISHHPTGMLDKVLLKNWFVFLEALKENRGPCFAQFPPHFDYSNKAILFHFLQQWPEEFELTLEFRHPSWFQDGAILPALTQFLQKRKIGLVILDVAGRRDLIHSSISAPYTMLRFIGNNLHPSDSTRVNDWSLRLKSGVIRV